MTIGFREHLLCKFSAIQLILDKRYPIGSGMVESAAKQYKDRFCGAGMRCSREGAERLIPVRSAILSKRFDKTWHLAYNSPPD